MNLNEYVENMPFKGLPNYDFWNGAIDSSDAQSMKLDLVETDKSFVVTVFTPGIKKENITVIFENDMLTISTSNKHLRNEKDMVHYMECVRTSSSRSIRLQHGKVDKDNITATYHDGELVVTLNFHDNYGKDEKVDIKIN